MITLQEAHESGWQGTEARKFVDWVNKVERGFERRTGLSVDLILGDWASADYFEDGFTVSEAVDALTEQVNQSDWWG